MNKAKRHLIRRYLRVYKHHQKLLDNPLCKRACQNSLFIKYIQDMLSIVPSEVQRYLRLRYFTQEPTTLANIAMDLSVSERTLNRWDRIIIKLIAEQVRKLHWK